jgi:hypothetical protein
VILLRRARQTAFLPAALAALPAVLGMAGFFAEGDFDIWLSVIKANGTHID